MKQIVSSVWWKAMEPTCLHDMVGIQESGTLPCKKQKRRAIGSGSQGSIAPIASQEMALQHLVSTTHTFSMQLMTLMTLTHKDRILFDIWGRFLCPVRGWFYWFLVKVVHFREGTRFGGFLRMQK